MACCPTTAQYAAAHKPPTVITPDRRFCLMSRTSLPAAPRRFASTLPHAPGAPGVRVPPAHHRRPAASQPGDDGHQPAPVLRLKQAGRVLKVVRHGRIQPPIPGVPERHRQRLAPLRPQRLGQQARRVIGASIGTIGTAMAQQHLRNVLVFRTCPPWPSPRPHPEQRRLVHADGQHWRGQQAFAGLMDSYVAWVKRHNA